LAVLSVTSQLTESGEGRDAAGAGVFGVSAGGDAAEALERPAQPDARTNSDSSPAAAFASS
jgi:hypothetical protein